MWRISRTFLIISLTVALVVACVLWAALWRMVLRPVRILTSNIIAFGERPQDASRAIAPSGRRDEIGRAETALAAMQASLADELTQRKRLAELGMAVARINHDLRNMLSAAQLISDRLAAIPDPLAQRLAPRLVATLDRAIQFCQATLTYGAARDLLPDRRRFDLSELVREVVDTTRAENSGAIDYVIDIPPRFDLYADRDHILRALENLCRNGTEALMKRGAQGGRPKAMRFAAIRTEGVALIEIGDTGPGFSTDQTDRIFEPFQKSTSPVGAGPRPGDRGRPGDAQRRRDRACSSQGGRLLLRRAIPDQIADAGKRRAQGLTRHGSDLKRPRPRRPYWNVMSAIA